MIGSIVLFFVLTIGLGFLVDLFIKDWKAGFFEKIVIRIGAGTLTIPVLGVLLNNLKIPLYWPIFLIFSVITFITAIFLRRSVLLSDLQFLKSPKFKIKKSQIYLILILIIFAISAYMYIQGSFNYPWFEDGDPYGYALTSKYIALEKTYDNPYYFMHFAYPYTQGYQIFMGILAQTNNSIYWNLKFFNSLIVSMSILFFYFFARRFFNKDSTAFWATFTLAAIPAWLSHFVFSLNFNMSLMFLLFYAIFMISKDKRWKYLAAIFYGSIIINHFYTSIVITALILIIYLSRVLVYKDFSKDYLDVILLGFFIGLVFWIPALWKHFDVLEGGSQLGGMDTFLPLFQALRDSLLIKIISLLGVVALILVYLKNDTWFRYIKKILNKKNIDKILYLSVLIISILVLVIPKDKLIYAKGSGSRIYTAADFFISQLGNMINNPIGIGWVIMILFIIGLVIICLNFKKIFMGNNFYLLVALTFSIFSFIGVMGASLSIGFVPFRMWTFFGMSLALVTGFGISYISSFLKIFTNKKQLLLSLKLVLAVILVIAVYNTSFSQKYWHNTAQWPEHQIMIPESQNLFIWMRDGLEKNSMVLPLCNYPSLVFGYDMLSKPWEDVSLADSSVWKPDDHYFFYRNSLNESLDENYQFLKDHNYDYTILGGDCIAKFDVDQNLLITRINQMINSSNFRLVQSTESEFLFEVI